MTGVDIPADNLKSRWKACEKERLAIVAERNRLAARVKELEAERDEHLEASAKYLVALTDASARVKMLEAALKPSAETKAAYIGEFRVPWPDIDEEGNEYTRQINVPWTTIKEIMAAIRSYAVGAVKVEPS